jgi:sulfonate transport system ATP-binding protein
VNSRFLSRAKMHDEQAALLDLRPEPALNDDSISDDASRTLPAGARGTLLSIDGLNKTFESRRVLTDIRLDIKAGEFVAVLGRSGCGKSTLLRLLAGLETPDPDRNARAPIRLNGKPKNGIDADTRIMFQDPRLLPWKSVIDNVALGLPKSARDAALSVLQAVDLLDRAGDWPLVLSGGQRQRVALARALIRSPRLLLLDEPLGALDALTRIEMQQLIERIWIEARFTTVLVTHDVNEAVALADRVVIMEDGRIGMNLPIDLPRPRERGTIGFARYERELLQGVLTSFNKDPAG